MPKYTQPTDACGLSLRAVIEGELLIHLPKSADLSYRAISNLATAIEQRIQDGPSDWIALSNGTTFEKTWIPELPDETENPEGGW